MADTLDRTQETVRQENLPANNGAIVAAFLSAGIGSFAVGAFVLLHISGVFSSPALYAPAGGVTGRTTFATIVWLVSWVILHRRWRDRHVRPGRMYALTLLLIGLSVAATFPPVWGLF